MGGLIQVVARLKNNSIISKVCVASTELNLCLTEEKFLEIIPELIYDYNHTEENDDDYSRKIKDLSLKEVISPTGYGIIFYDYKNKKAFSFQSYCATLEFSLLNMFCDFGFNSWVVGENKSIENFGLHIEKETLRNIKLFEELKEKECLFKFNTLERLDLKNMDTLSAFHYFMDKKDPMSKTYLTLKREFYRLSVKYPGWDFYSGTEEEDKMKVLREYLIKEKLIDSIALKEWEDYFN